jgi:hypothetical protein
MIRINKNQISTRVLSLLLLISSLSTFGQDSLHLTAKADKKTVFLGSSSTITLELEGIKLNFEPQIEKNNITIFDSYFSDKSNKNQFQMRFKVTPKDTGVVKFGPYSITVLGQQLTSNIVQVHCIKQGNEEVKISIPEQVVVNQVVKLEITNFSNSGYQVKLKNLDFLKVLTTSTSVRTYDSNITRTISMNVIFLKKGKFEFNKTCFETLPEFVQVPEVKVVVK